MNAAKFVTYNPPSGPSQRIYRTGDRGKLLDNGEIAFLGRVDDQVKIRGYRIELGEIVAALLKCPGVETGAVVVSNREPVGPALVAYVVARTDAKLAAGELRAHLSARLPDYMVPAKFVAVATLPMTANGKLDKSALPAPDASNLLASGTAHVSEPASSDFEKNISAMVASLLEQPSVGRDDNFFMLGGHSMLGVQLVARIRDAFSVKLTLRQLFNAPTVAALSQQVAQLATMSTK